MIEYRYAEGKLDRLPELAAELAHLKVDVIVALGGSLPIRAVRNASKTIPIVLGSAASDPLRRGLLKASPVQAVT